MDSNGVRISIIFLQDHKLIKQVDDQSENRFPEPENGIRWIHIPTNDISVVAVSTNRLFSKVSDNTELICVRISHVSLGAIQAMYWTRQSLL